MGTQSTITLRRAGDADRTAIARLFAQHLETLGHLPDPELDADMVDLARWYTAFLVAVRADGTIVGMGGLARGELRRLFVLPEVRRNGLARRIAAELVAHARAVGEVPWALVAKSNGAARRFFESLGFSATGRSPLHPKLQESEIFDGSRAC